MKPIVGQDLTYILSFAEGSRNTLAKEAVVEAVQRLCNKYRTTSFSIRVPSKFMTFFREVVNVSRDMESHVRIKLIEC